MTCPEPLLNVLCIFGILWDCSQDPLFVVMYQPEHRNSKQCNTSPAGPPGKCKFKFCDAVWTCSTLHSLGPRDRILRMGKPYGESFHFSQWGKMVLNTWTRVRLPRFKSRFLLYESDPDQGIYLCGSLSSLSYWPLNWTSYTQHIRNGS